MQAYGLILNKLQGELINYETSISNYAELGKLKVFQRQKFPTTPAYKYHQWEIMVIFELVKSFHDICCTLSSLAMWTAILIPLVQLMFFYLLNTKLFLFFLR